MIVIDVGCARWGNEGSIERLLAEFEPDRLFGFDPAGETGYGYGETEIAGTPCLLAKAACWTYDGRVGFWQGGNCSSVDPTAILECECVDLDRIVREAGPGTVLKLDCEGGEYTLLRHLVETGADTLLSLAWVEWHRHLDETGEQELWLRDMLACKIRPWTW